jgi:hypothetical protein
MKLKKTGATIILSALLSGIALAQTMQLTGTVISVTRTQITLHSGSDTWVIARTSATSVTGTLVPNASITVQCAVPDAHKNENPTLTPTPANQ